MYINSKNKLEPLQNIERGSLNYNPKIKLINIFHQHSEYPQFRHVLQPSVYTNVAIPQAGQISM